MLLHIFICDDWFISRRKLFQKSFENVFEVLEKEKEIEIISFSAFGPKACCCPPQQLAHSASVAREPSSLSRVANGPAQPSAVEAATPSFSLFRCQAGPACKRCRLLPLARNRAGNR
jgi:hypothetical protein